MNWRVKRILDAAEERGYSVEASVITPDCWTVKAVPDTGESLTVFGEANDSARVYYDRAGQPNWDLITQSDAIRLLRSEEGLSTSMEER